MSSQAEQRGGFRILFLDAYDSFSNNIVALLKQTLQDDVSIYVLHVDLTTPRWDPSPDWTAKDFLQRLGSFDAVVCGPGPGSPSCEKDVGASRWLWELADHEMIPVLGICLGFQSLVASCGGRVVRLTRGLHGMVRQMEHRGDDIFRGVPPFRATLYHSLCADVGQHRVAAWRERRWEPTTAVPDLVPLAWAAPAPDDGNERVLMAVRHRSKPFWGLQYHPESICTDVAAHHVLRNWYADVREWNSRTKRPRGNWQPTLVPSPGRPRCPAAGPDDARNGRMSCSGPAQSYAFRTFPMPVGLDAAAVVEALGSGDDDAIVLDSSSACVGDALARSSIIALGLDRALRLEHRAKEDYLTLRRPGKGGLLRERRDNISLASHGASVWDALTDFWRCRTPDAGDGGFADCAFRGGFMGFITYEMGLSSIVAFPDPRQRGHRRPDICFAWVERSVVLDHKAGLVHVQGIGARSEIEPWLEETVAVLVTRAATPESRSRDDAPTNGVAGRPRQDTTLRDQRECSRRLRFEIPDKGAYEKQVSQCQEAIRAGESYELCLTAATTMTRPRVPSGAAEAAGGGACSARPWAIYKELRRRQPAPFGSFVRLGGATVLSSSPERFLAHDSQGLCAMRPMKGTVRKSDAVATLAQAEELLRCPKEEAENLMIVDLVRHDLYGLCGPGQVTVPELLKVEEYATVFQMVTAVHGQLPLDRIRRTLASVHEPPFHGLHVLEAALPPGSMTGAPKVRSCEILWGLERRERSLYSGVVGYFDVTGQADWSVTIRTMFRWDDDWVGEGSEERELWQIGAGGAVTILSTPEGEADEMFTKLRGPLGVFQDTA